jgi:hypothetical protein
MMVRSHCPGVPIFMALLSMQEHEARQEKRKREDAERCRMAAGDRPPYVSREFLKSVTQRSTTQ